MNIAPVVPIVRSEAFDGDGWLFELKLDGFRGLADIGFAPRVAIRPIPASYDSPRWARALKREPSAVSGNR